MPFSVIFKGLDRFEGYSSSGMGRGLILGENPAVVLDNLVSILNQNI